MQDQQGRRCLHVFGALCCIVAVIVSESALRVAAALPRAQTPTGPSFDSAPRSESAGDRVDRHAGTIPHLEPRFFDQAVDHFNSADARTFKQKYYVYDAFQRPRGAAILFYCGAETASMPSYLATNLSVAFYAQRLGALVVAAEHRYFGESLPFGNASYSRDNIQYLAIEQTLADYAAIIVHVRATSPGLQPDGKAVAFGGSYGGHLSALMRLHHGDVVTGSVASAAATCTYGNVPDDTWYALVSATYRCTVVTIHGDDRVPCGSLVEYTFGHLWACVFNASCRAALQSHLRLCTPVASASDGYLLTYYARSAFSLAVQFNYPCVCAPTHVASPLTTHVCMPATAEEKLLTVLELVYGNATCFPFKGPAAAATADVAAALASSAGGRAQSRVSSSSARHVARRRRADSRLDDSPVGIQVVPFSYIGCRDFPQPIGGVGIFEVPSPVNFTRIADACQARWGIRPSLGKWRSFVQEPLLTNGTNIAFINAGFDPVRGYSPDHNLSGTVVALSAEMGHTYDLFYPSSVDPPDVRTLREQVLEVLTRWLSGDVAPAGRVPRDFGETVETMCAHEL